MASKSGSFKGKDGFKIWLGLSTLVVILDQLTKFITLTSINESTTKPITSFLNWVLVYNPGAAFSLLAQSGGWQKWFFIGIGSVAAIVMIWLLKRHSHQGIFSFSISLLLGGAIGNVIDRARWGAVFDFADFHVGEWHWPAFNVADSAIVMGVGLLLLDSLISERESAP